MATYRDYEYLGYHVRHFPHDTESVELVWHRDRKDRYITPIGETDWQIQFDNELPRPINDCIFIPEGKYHRVIKGKGCLKILINEQD
jgi:hypothetical protein